MNGNLIIENATELVTCSGFRAKRSREMPNLNVIPNGTVIITDEIITAVGASAEVPEGFDRSGYTVIDAQNRAFLPVFVDSHTQSELVRLNRS